MDIEIIILCQIYDVILSNIICYHLYVESKIMIQMNLLTNKNRLTDTGNKFMAIKGDSPDRGIN